MTDKSAGPFTVAKEELERETHPFQLVAVLGADGHRFAYVAPEDCVGLDIAAAKARATRIAESLNKTEGHLAAMERLVRASRVAFAANQTALKPCGEMDELKKALEPFAELVP